MRASCRTACRGASRARPARRDVTGAVDFAVVAAKVASFSAHSRESGNPACLTLGPRLRGDERKTKEMPLRNLITDVAGLKVGNADDAKLGSGATPILFHEP